jgi:hypothetical protein
MAYNMAKVIFDVGNINWHVSAVFFKTQFVVDDSIM